MTSTLRLASSCVSFASCAALAAASLATGCSNAAPGSAPTDSGIGVADASGGADGGPGADGGTGTDGGAGPVTTATTFAPVGCPYVVQAPAAELDFPPFEAASTAVGAGDPTPRHVRIGLGGGVVKGMTGYADPSTSVAIGWEGDYEAMPTTIQWGTSASSLTNSAEGYTYLVPQEISSGPANGIRFHEVHVCGLTPGRTYSYRVGGGAAGAQTWSPVYSFTTAPAPSTTETVQIGITGDARDSVGSSTYKYPAYTQMLGRMKAAGVPQTLFSGDAVFLGYNADIWESYLTASDAYMASGFLASAPGNHETEDIAFFARTPMPAGGTNAQRYSSYDWGLVHVIVMDDYYGIIDGTNPAYGPELTAWLMTDLAAASANRANVPWIITVHHHPFFSSTNQADRAPERAAVIKALEPAYDKYGVDMDFVGHDHFYERHYPTLNGVPNKTSTGAIGQGTTYVVLGTSGAPAYGQTSPLAPTSNVVVNYNDQTNEGIYSILTATQTALKLTTYKFTSIGGSSPSDDSVVDTVTLSH